MDSFIKGVAPILAVMVTGAGFLLIYVKPEVKTEIIGLMTLVLSFYFGSSKGSEAKNDVIKEQLKREG
jgi:hypothetical protein